MHTKQQTVVLLRWVLIIAFSYLLILDASDSGVQPQLVGLIVVALASNLLIGRLPPAWADSRIFDFAVVLFDVAWVTWGLMWAPHVSGDLFLLYFLVIFVAAMGESLPIIVGSATVVSLVYGYTLLLQSGTTFQPTTAALLRVPFLFVVALFYGYFVTEIRGRRNEAAEAQLRENAKSELLAAVSHDLRGPLGNAENLLALALTPEYGTSPDRNLLLRAQVNVQRVSSLVDNLLETACIEAGAIQFRLVPIQINEVVDEVLHIHGAAADLKQMTITKELHPHLPTIVADTVQVGRIIANLVDNAIKYTGNGGAVTVRTAYATDAVTLSVHDTGPGLTADQCNALFAKFRRVHLGGYTQGTGLGLYIVKSLAEGLGGRVRVTSQPGQGSTFTVHLPRREHTDNPRGLTTRSAAKGRTPRASSVLLEVARA